MLDLIHEAGYGAWFVLLFLVAGVAATLTVGRKSARPGTIAACFAVAILAAGALGSATGQHKVDRAVRAIPENDLKSKIEAMSIGTRETSSNLLLAGACAMILLGIGGTLALANKNDKPEV